MYFCTLHSRMMSLTLGLFLVWAALSSPTLLAKECQPLQVPTPALELSTPDGPIFVNILTRTDGPVRLPIESPQVDSLQLTTRTQGDRLTAIFHTVTNDVDIELFGTWELDLPPQISRLRQYAVETPVPLPGTDLTKIDVEALPSVEMYELSGIQAGIWSMKITVLQPSVLKAGQGTCACCSCSSLYCCPNAGKCLGCGDCGDCCCTGGPE